ncbi:MAG: hypothetical protein AAF573_04190 [Bacteroidota bacterium]
MRGRSIDLRWLVIPLVGLTIGLGYFVEQSDFYPLIGQYGIFFSLYLAICHFTKDRKKILFFVFVGILLRLILVFSLPNLSDDVYRFIWDGRLLIQGHNPFDYLPSYYVENQIPIKGINEALFEKLNSPEYFTIYPPVAQGVFAIACWLFPNSIIGSAITMKLFLFGCEIGSLFFIKKLLEHFELPLKNILLYALNPLIIIELCGNLHFEAAMIFFLLAGIFFMVKKENLVASAVMVALSVASKLLPLMFLPFFIKRLGWKKSVQYFFVIGFVIVLLFVPLLSGVFLNNFGKSLDLYFQKFEFNASIYYLSREFGYYWVGYNWIQRIGPFLALLVLLGILSMAFFEKNWTWKSLFQKMLFAICLYLALATIVHPWYVSLPVVLCLFTRFRFPILWSGLVFLTYVNYSYSEYFENLWMVGVEYGLVFGFFIYEVWRIVLPRRLKDTKNFSKT